jgi:hypothetical protein
VADHELVLEQPADALDRRSTGTRPSRLDPKPVQVAAKTDLGAVPETAARSELGTFAGVAEKVSAKPRLAFRQEVADERLRVGPAATTRRRDCHHDAASRVDDDPKST